MYDVSEFILNTDTKAFANNNIYSGQFTISGTLSGGMNRKSITVPLPEQPDMSLVQFRNPNATSAWFISGAINVDITVPNTIVCILGSYISGNSIVLYGDILNPYSFTTTLVSSTVNYRLIDYSVF